MPLVRGMAWGGAGCFPILVCGDGLRPLKEGLNLRDQNSLRVPLGPEVQAVFDLLCKRNLSGLVLVLPECSQEIDS